MADISIQFHALPDELLPFIKQCAQDFGLHVVSLAFFPFEAKEINPALLDMQFTDPSSPQRRLALTVGLPALPATSGNDFADRNPDKLLLDIGVLDSKGLRESWLTTRAKDPEAVSVWKQIVKRLKEQTQQGAIAVNPTNGATSQLRKHRFTLGALRLASSGVTILPAAGTSVLRLGSSDEDVSA